ncbi:MAG: phytanoyl-CoA dioxygenase family protein [Acidobacteriota bacterium]
MVDDVVQQRTAAELRASYAEHGYLVVADLLTRADIARLRAALADVLKDAEGLTEIDERFFVAVGEDGTPAVTRVRNPVAHHHAFRELVTFPRLLDLIDTIIGPNLQFVHSKINLKPPRNREAAYPWHQDWPFNPHTNLDMLAVMIPLDDADEQNGCLRVISGSHKYGPVDHRYGGYFCVKDETLVEDRSRHVSLVVPAGGVALYHCCLLHSSTANFGAASRNAIFFDYRAADNVQLGGATGPHRGLLVRGVDPLSVRMMPGTFTVRDTPRRPA